MKLVAVAFALFTLASTPAPAQVSGTWTFDFERDTASRYLPPAPDTAGCTMKQDGRRLTGSCGSDEVRLMGIVNGDRITVRVQSASVAVLTAKVSADGTTMKGTWRDRERFGKFSATKR
jgi:hypothetical protein